ncbi:MAG: hypothetical protein ACE5KF_12080 [Kiloniellaceae bacterium]
MVRISLLSLSLAAALAALAACSGPAVHFRDFYSVYTPGDVRYATKDGPMPVEALGQVTLEERLEGEALERVVARALSRFGPHWFAGGFRAIKSEDEDPLYRVRWLFNIPVGFPTHSACARDLGTQPSGWTEETGLVVAAFCRGKRILIVAKGSYGRPGAIDTTAFPRFIGIMGREILPLRDPTRDREDEDCRRLRRC